MSIRSRLNVDGDSMIFLGTQTRCVTILRFFFFSSSLFLLILPAINAHFFPFSSNGCKEQLLNLPLCKR